MQVEIKGKGEDKVMVITIPCTKTVSKSGKSILIATTNGNKPTDVKVDGKVLTVSVNAYIPKD